MVGALATPLTTAETIAAGVVSMTAEQKLACYAGYIPFFAVPFMIAVDMAFRISKLMQVGINTEAVAKVK